MSRPSDIFSSNCGINPGYNYLVIGNTLAAAAETINLYEAGSPVIFFLTQGPSRSHNTNIRHPGFALREIKTILDYLTCINVRHRICDKVLDTRSYYIGSGVLGDMIAAYYIPRVGPWFIGDGNKWSSFVDRNTLKRCNTPAENTVVGRLATVYKLNVTANVTNGGPSILNCVYAFLSRCGDCTNRNLFYPKTSGISSRPEINHICSPCEVHSSIVSTDYQGDTYNITAGDIAATGVKIRWKCHPYMYLKLHHRLSGRSCCKMLPAFYRTVLAIPLDNVATGGVLLNSENPIDLDYLSSYISFSLGNSNCKSSRISWNISAYTTAEDASQTGLGGVFAAPDQTLLIVEGICNENIRKVVYCPDDDTVELIMNDDNTENDFLHRFAHIVAEVKSAYTGTPIAIADILGSVNACVNNVCTKVTPTIIDGLRESPLQTVVHMEAMLFGHNSTDGSYPLYE
uniref:Uncharacterized protein n=1 Tax=viral metagenome TaxID=1070528 RepID=A0A6C0JV84_9ZZZZ